MTPEIAIARIEALTSREREVLKLLASGANSKQIATLLGIATSTVVSYRSRIRWKTGTHNIAELVRVAMIGGLVE